MPLGDSITIGYNIDLGSNNTSGYWSGYRKPLYLSLLNAGYQFDFVGSQSNGQFAGTFDYDHEGHGGQTAAYIASNIYTWLTNNPADIVLLHIGTNDLNGNPLNTAAADVERILDEIDRFDQGITVLLARIIQNNPQKSYITEFNNNVQAMADARIAAGDKIIIIDQEHALTEADMSDMLHPNEQGYAKMANTWFASLNSGLMLCTPDLSVLPSSYNFGEQYLNNGSQKSFTVKNNGSGDLTIGPCSVSGTNAADFRIANDLCSGKTLGMSQSCSIEVHFTPTTEGTKNAKLVIPSNEQGSSSFEVPLSGTGISAGNDIPSKPQLISPGDGALISGSTVELKWRNSVDPNGDNVTYKVYCCENQDFTGCEPQNQGSTSALGFFGGAGLLLFGLLIKERKKVVLTAGLLVLISIFQVSCGMSGSNNDEVNANESSFNVQNLQSGTYYWKIEADDGKGGTNQSATRSFDIE